MKGRYPYYILFLIASIVVLRPGHVYANGKPGDKVIEKLLKADIFHEQGDFAVFNEKIAVITAEMKRKKSAWKNDHTLLRHLFYKVHRKYLKQYQPFTSFRDLFENGTYSCVSGTVLYALLIRDLGYEFDIIESNYHMFILVKLDNGRIMIESTDPLSGFVSSEKEIESRIAELKQQEMEKMQHDPQFTFAEFRKLSLDEVVGVHYYNNAIRLYNSQQYLPALVHLNLARKFYDAARLREFSEVIIEKVNSDANTSSSLVGAIEANNNLASL